MAGLSCGLIMEKTVTNRGIRQGIVDLAGRSQQGWFSRDPGPGVGNGQPTPGSDHPAAWLDPALGGIALLDIFTQARKASGHLVPGRGGTGRTPQRETRPSCYTDSSRILPPARPLRRCSQDSPPNGLSARACHPADQHRSPGSNDGGNVSMDRSPNRP